MAHVELDLRFLKCPLPVLRTKQALARMLPGDTLRVQCTDEMALIDIPVLVLQSGDTMMRAVPQHQGVFSFEIAKGAPAPAPPSNRTVC